MARLCMVPAFLASGHAMRRRPSRATLPLLIDTATASSEVIAARLQGLAAPGALFSPKQLQEVQRMVAEKATAAAGGTWAAWQAATALPMQWMFAGARLDPWQPASWLSLWSTAFELWTGVGNAALRPATRAVVANRKRLRRTGKVR